MTNVVNNKTNDNGSTSEKLVSEDIMNDEGNTGTVEEGVDSLVNEDRENFDKVMVEGSNPDRGMARGKEEGDPTMHHLESVVVAS
ncbi:hypothetical protein Tco_0287730 [Tanacetum coccineum]